MKQFNVPLFRKFAIITTLIVLVFGVTNLYFLWNSAYKSFEHEIDKRSKVLSAIIAERVLQPIVYHNYVNIYKELDEIKSNDPSVAYIFVLDNNNKILAQTYETKIPFTLISANETIGGRHNIKVIHTQNFQHKVIRDIAYPILNSNLGTVRLGLIEENIRKELNIASRTLSLMVLSFLVIGLIGAFFFSFMITLPIKKITKTAQDINLKEIGKEEFKIAPLRFRKMFNMYFSDELDILVAKFMEMMQRLKGNVKELEATRDSFIQAEKLASIGTLTAGISHEINNPLTGIKNCVERIEKNPTNTEQNLSYFYLIKEAIDKIEGVVRPLLDFSRKPDLSKSEVRPIDIVEKALQLTEYKIRKFGIKLVKMTDPEIIINSTPNLLEQVMINLILNGIDAINEKAQLEDQFQGKLNISTFENENDVLIQVADNGIGIPPENHHKIFDPFFTSKQVGEGTGLGLYVSYNIILELGGQLLFDSVPNGITTFTIKLKK